MDKREEFDDVSAAYGELEKPEPSPKLDQAILRAAQEELDAAQKTARGDFWQQWLKPLSTVAVLGVCLTVVLQVMDNTPTMTPPAPKARSESAELAMSRAPKEADMEVVRREQVVGAAAESAPALKPQLDAVSRAKRQSTSIGDAPAAAQAYSADEMILTSKVSEPEPALADDALTAWNNGARPAPDVWRSGIESSREDRNQKEINEELSKLERAAGNAVAEDINAIASEWAWVAGIDLLYESGDDERAEAELARYQQIYIARPGE